MRIKNTRKYGKGDCKFRDCNMVSYTSLQNTVNSVKLSISNIIVENDKLEKMGMDYTFLSEYHKDMLLNISYSLHDLMAILHLKKNNKPIEYDFNYILYMVNMELENILPYCGDYKEFIISLDPIPHNFDYAANMVRKMETFLGEQMSSITIEPSILSYVNRLSTFLFWLGRYYDGNRNFKYWKKFSHTS